MNVAQTSSSTAGSSGQTQMFTTRSGIRLHIADSGKGFSQMSRGGAGLGLPSMRERVRFAGGRMAIRSTAGHGGTHLVVNLPMHQAVSGVDHGDVPTSDSLDLSSTRQRIGGSSAHRARSPVGSAPLLSVAQA